MNNEHIASLHAKLAPLAPIDAPSALQHPQARQRLKAFIYVHHS